MAIGVVSEMVRGVHVLSRRFMSAFFQKAGRLEVVKEQLCWMVVGDRRVMIYGGSKMKVKAIWRKIVERRWKGWFGCTHFLEGGPSRF